MNRNVIRLNESQLRQIVRESVKNVLNESDENLYGFDPASEFNDEVKTVDDVINTLEKLNIEVPERGGDGNHRLFKNNLSMYCKH